MKSKSKICYFLASGLANLIGGNLSESIGSA
jgi:hypothetical protein